MQPEDLAKRHAMLRKTIQDLVNKRSIAVQNLRKAGIRVADAPDDTTYVGKGNAVNQRVPPQGEEPNDTEPDEDADEGTPQANGAGKQLDANTAAMFVRQAGGDNNKARMLALAAGYKVGSQ